MREMGKLKITMLPNMITLYMIIYHIVNNHGINIFELPYFIYIVIIKCYHICNNFLKIKVTDMQTKTNFFVCTKVMNVNDLIFEIESTTIYLLLCTHVLAFSSIFTYS